MAKFKMTFFGTERSQTQLTELECYLAWNNEILITIKDGSTNSINYIHLDKSTAIKFAKQYVTTIVHFFRFFHTISL